jgi:Uma2 family endonuclease
MALALHPTQERVILHGVTWATFERLLADRGDHASVRIAYDQGSMELTMPSAAHETVKQFLVLIVDAIALARDLHLLNVGSTTFTRADLACGFEPDACFYIQHVETLRHPEHIDLTVDPPPDLVIEIDITSPSLNKLPIYTALGIPEVWWYTREGLTLYQFSQDRVIS